MHIVFGSQGSFVALIYTNAVTNNGVMLSVCMVAIMCSIKVKHMLTTLLKPMQSRLHKAIKLHIANIACGCHIVVVTV